MRFPITNHREIRPWESSDIRYFIFNRVQCSFGGHFIMECCLYPCRTSKLGRWRTTPCHKTRNATCTPAFFPVCARVFRILQRFSLELHTERILYYRNLGLYYGLASTPLPLYSKPRVGVADGCPSCEKPWALGQTLLNQ